MVTPYTEIVKGRTRTRTFESSVDGEELVWHRDRQTRTVKVLEGTGWRFQMDNHLSRPGDCRRYATQVAATRLAKPIAETHIHSRLRICSLPG